MDKITAEKRSKNMRAIRSKGTDLEMRVRRLIHGMGYRYRLHSTKLPGRPDLVFAKQKKVILVNGCYWHQHDDPSCRIARLPKSHRDYWLPKLARNRDRDRNILYQLKELGWSILILWECEIEGKADLKERIKLFLSH
jgi:DNA mismatch endonuclease (patch repair protein)